MNKNDLRYIKTEANIKSTYLELLSQNTNKQITVKEICKLAQCSRNTFYLHYETRDQLEMHLITDILDNMAFAFFPQEKDLAKFDSFNNRLYTDAIIDSVIKIQESLYIFLENDTGIFSKALSDTIFNQCLESVESYLPNEITPDIRIAFRYLSNSITGFIVEWLTHTQLKAEEAKKLLFYIHEPIIKSINMLLITSVSNTASLNVLF
ncbi:TetR/AcrR family transcriptional regulator [Streptococcus suis]|nr:TetR/AcrR family transcriptional regulator [Streptococcus suis]